ncbi:B3 domain-containing protein Os07g0563300-like isoform X2 [Carex rostrata]
MSSVAAAAPAPPQRTCFNTFCKEPTKSDGHRRRGWRLRSGEFADLCDRCLCIYEQGNFCETFHLEVAGWRSCEACGKRVHCGCIVSLPSYVLLDAGGVDCMACARKIFGMAPSPVWVPSPSMHHPRMPTMRPPAGTPFPGHWRQASNLWNTNSVQSDLQQRLAFEFDRPSCSEKFLQQVRASAALQQHQQQQQHVADKKFDEMPERSVVPAMPLNAISPITRERFGANGSGAPGLDPAYPYSIYHRAEGGNSNPSTNGLPHGHHISDPNVESHVNSGVYRDESGSGLPVLSPTFQQKEQIRVGHGQMAGPSSSGSPMKPQFFSPTDGGGVGDMRNGTRPRLDIRARSQVLPRYWPRSTGQELQQINGEGSNSVITPLFEKMLSASDAGRIGRLVLPKKCAEAYFPTISQPEGLPLTVQDASGKEWQFQFRFWPNNNSRMYVLEGVTPCIQAMQLQAGDTVTFSRIDPEGKLVMGFRKASAPGSGESETQHLKSSNGFLTCPPPENNPKISTSSEPKEANANQPEWSNNPENKGSGLAYVPQEGGFVSLMSKPPPPSQAGPVKRKGSSLGAKIKRLKIETEESMELKLNWEEAQSLLRAPSNSVSTVTVIDGNEFEEFQEPPVVGRRTYFVTSQMGERHQWVQCEECNKWRKVPVDALLNAKWSCSQNTWDVDRSSCSSPAELTVEQLAELIPYRTGGGTKRSKVKHETSEAAIHGSDGLDTLANLAILGESESISGSSVAGADLPTTTRHPRHRPGCSCIVCIQPPSGKGPKHKQSCTCNVCNTVRRRFRTLMMRRGGKGQSESSSDPPTCPTSPTPPMSPQPSAGGAYVGDVGPKGQSGIVVDVGPSPSPIGSAVAGMILF